MLKNDCCLFASLHVTSQTRNGDLDSFFAHENQGYPVPGFLECLLPFAAPSYTSPVTDALVLDGTANV